MIRVGKSYFVPMKLQWKSRRWIIVLIHISVWVFLYFIPSLLRPSEADTMRGNNPRSDMMWALHYLANYIGWAFLFYINAYLLVPRFLTKKRYWSYVLSLIVCYSVPHLLNRISLYYLLPEHRSFPLAYVTFFFFPTIFFVSMSIAYRLIADRILADNAANAREKEHLKTELAFLRSQVSPHFMFNVLNGMVVLARKKSDQLESLLFKLSSLMRYMLYETDEKKVTLERELEYIQSYTDLQMQRFGNQVKLTMKIEFENRLALIEPMLLIPFVENAFKHGTGWKEFSEINIMIAEKENRLNFTVGNYYREHQQKDATSGIGLQNVKKRLELLYPGRYQLDLQNDGNYFKILLELKLD